MMAQLLNEKELNEVTGGDGGKAPFIIYKIRNNDTLSQLAIKFKTTVAEIQRLNEIMDPNIIKVDQEIILPNNID